MNMKGMYDREGKELSIDNKEKHTLTPLPGVCGIVCVGPMHIAGSEMEQVDNFFKEQKWIVKI